RRLFEIRKVAHSESLRSSPAATKGPQMANFIVSYDLNGSTPSHKQVDQLLEKLGAVRGRILETVWYVGWSGTRDDLYDAVNSILTSNDRIFVADANDAVFRNLLVQDQALINAWNANR